MALIQLNGMAADKYRQWLDAYKAKTGREPGPEQRTEAFFCARSTNDWDRPSWIQ